MAVLRLYSVTRISDICTNIDTDILDDSYWKNFLSLKCGSTIHNTTTYNDNYNALVIQGKYLTEANPIPTDCVTIIGKKLSTLLMRNIHFTTIDHCNLLQILLEQNTGIDTIYFYNCDISTKLITTINDIISKFKQIKNLSLMNLKCDRKKSYKINDLINKNITSLEATFYSTNDLIKVLNQTQITNIAIQARFNEEYFQRKLPLIAKIIEQSSLKKICFENYEQCEIAIPHRIKYLSLIKKKYSNQNRLELFELLKNNEIAHLSFNIQNKNYKLMIDIINSNPLIKYLRIEKETTQNDEPTKIMFAAFNNMLRHNNIEIINTVDILCKHFMHSIFKVLIDNRSIIALYVNLDYVNQSDIIRFIQKSSVEYLIVKINPIDPRKYDPHLKEYLVEFKKKQQSIATYIKKLTCRYHDHLYIVSQIIIDYCNLNHHPIIEYF